MHLSCLFLFRIPESLQFAASACSVSSNVLYIHIPVIWISRAWEDMQIFTTKFGGSSTWMIPVGSKRPTFPMLLTPPFPSPPPLHKNLHLLLLQHLQSWMIEMEAWQRIWEGRKASMGLCRVWLSIGLNLSISLPTSSKPLQHQPSPGRGHYHSCWSTINCHSIIPMPSVLNLQLLVACAPFHNFFACAAPKWLVFSYHFFAPECYKGRQKEVNAASLSLCCK